MQTRIGYEVLGWPVRVLCDHSEPKQNGQSSSTWMIEQVQGNAE